MSSLTDAHIEAQARLRARTALIMGQAWDNLGSYDEADVAPFLATAVPVTTAAQRASVALTGAFLARALARRPIGLDPATVLKLVRNGTPPAEVYRRPFVTAWKDLKEGKPWTDAVGAARARVVSNAEMDVQLAMRSAFAVGQQADPQIKGYRRVPDAGACPFCLAVAGAFVKSANAMPLHNHCGCGLEPVTEPVHVTPTPDDVAVHHHGELGPVLADPRDHFTGPAAVTS